KNLVVCPGCRKIGAAQVTSRRQGKRRCNFEAAVLQAPERGRGDSGNRLRRRLIEIGIVRSRGVDKEDVGDTHLSSEINGRADAPVVRKVDRRVTTLAQERVATHV